MAGNYTLRLTSQPMYFHTGREESGEESIQLLSCCTDTAAQSDDSVQSYIASLVSFPDPNNPSADHFQYLARGRRVWGFDRG